MSVVHLEQNLPRFAALPSCKVPYKSRPGISSVGECSKQWQAEHSLECTAPAWVRPWTEEQLKVVRQVLPNAYAA